MYKDLTKAEMQLKVLESSLMFPLFVRNANSSFYYTIKLKKSQATLASQNEVTDKILT